jgi:GNAT superfamily N-acetyltransferase
VDARDARCGGVHGPHGIPGNAGGVQGGLRPLRAGAGRSKAASLLPWVSLQPPQRRVAKKKAIEELSKLIREEKDKEKSAAVEYTEWVDNEDPKQVLNRIDAHAGGRNVGYLTAHPSTEGDGMWLKGLKVAPRFRQHGIGAELMRRALDQYGDRTIRLRPRPYAGSPLDEDQLAAWYGRFGFTPYDSDGRMVRYPEKSASLLPWVSLQPPQRRVAKKVREGNNLLVYHGLGSGKSLASLAAAESVGGPYAAIVPASLRSNYKKEQEKFTDMRTPSDVLSYTGVGMGKQPRVNPQTIIMDEVQRLRNPASAGSRAAMELAMRVPHRVLLSGTPIVNDPHDLAVPISILTGQEMTPREFDRRFVGEKTVHPGLGGWLRGVQPTTVPSIKNEEDLERLLEGHVDYQPSKSPQGVTTNDERVEVDLSPEQQKFYKLMWGKLPWLMRWKLSHDYPLSRDELTHLSSFMTGPRQAALSLYPFHSSRDPLFAYRTSAKLQAAMSSLKETLAKDPRAKAIVYSNFIDAGLTPYAAALAAAKIPYGQFHGTMDEAARKQALDDYNAGRSRVLLLGPAAAEGISAKGTQLIQLLDPHWNEARLGQARGRGLRFDSHEGLPPELRNVRIQRFIARMPQPGLFGRLIGASHRPSADEVLEQQAHRKEELIEPFRDVLRRVGTEPERRPWFGLFG